MALVPRLVSCLRTCDTCARMGGDEFVVLLDDVRDLSGVVDVAQRMQEQIATFTAFDGHEIRLTASMGIVLGQGADHGADEILRDADIAMYRAKSAGRARYEVFDVKMREALVARVALERALGHAVREDRLRVVYQPIVSLASGRLLGVEALVRWPDPTRGMLLPDAFVPLAAESNLIVEMDRWVMRAACRQLRRWREAHPATASVRVNVNVSTRHVMDRHFAEDVQAVLDESGLGPSSLELEISESVLLDDVPVVQGILADLRELGVRVAIDDFGTGYSSLAYLAQLPVDTVKVDRTFVRDLQETAGGNEVVGTIMALARSLKMAAIAEGVETTSQRLLLRGLGCEWAQGFLIAQPVEADAVPSGLAADGCWTAPRVH